MKRARDDLKVVLALCDEAAYLFRRLLDTPWAFGFGLVSDLTKFVDALLAKESLALARENLKVFDEIVRVSSARVAAGDLAGVELVRTRLAALQFGNAFYVKRDGASARDEEPDLSFDNFLCVRWMRGRVVHGG